ncbi:MAG: cob(I)yrinic acid a,c-diamide adenosyltransferase [Alphaproteobacteria bacterium]|nr:cob(I)yrinic acid a,c-diamide adenosyltransferase [Alphaproteobacteria bacterium]
MVTLDRIYTKGGDTGKTSLGNQKRVSKTDPRIEAIGTVDEANAFIGFAVIHCAAPIIDIIHTIQNDLFDVGADLCVPEDPSLDHAPLRITKNHIKNIENIIDRLNATLPPLTSFVLPGGTSASAALHVARTVVRRAERRVLVLNTAINPMIIQYLNRLSDLLFVLARIANQEITNGDILWTPGTNH